MLRFMHTFILGLLLQFTSFNTHALEAVAIDDSTLDSKVLERLAALQNQLNDLGLKVSRMYECNDRLRVYDHSSGGCARPLDRSGGGSDDDTFITEFPTPSECRDSETLAWRAGTWVCLIKPEDLVTPPTCEVGIETLHYEDGLWSCQTITASQGNNGNDGSNGNDGNDGSNGNGSNSNTNINININRNHNSITQPTTPNPVGTCKLRNRNGWACDADKPGLCSGTSENPSCSCENGYRRKTILSMADRKHYLCILD